MSRVKGDGDCFPVACHLVWTGEYKDNVEARVCHGMVTRPADGLRHWHAWVEVLDVYAHPAVDRPIYLWTCVDKSNGHDTILPQALYYHLGKIENDEVYRYTQDDVVRLMATTQHYGPWEDQ